MDNMSNLRFQQNETFYSELLLNRKFILKNCIYLKNIFLHPC